MISLVEMLENTAKKKPNSVAIKVGNEEITYATLDTKATALANSLVDLGVQKNDRVAFLFHKSIESVVALYGIMKAGAAYVPLDVKSPPKRLKLILNDCSIHVLITTPRAFKQLAFIINQTKIEHIIGLDKAPSIKIKTSSWEDGLAIKENANQLPQIYLDDLCYILYTSGSTGTPKGIVHTHKSAFSFVSWSVEQFALSEKDIVSNHAPFHFDLSTFDLFASCLVGAKVLIIPEYLTKFPASINQLIEKEGISVWYSVPSALIQLLKQGKLDAKSSKSLRIVLFAGEVFPVKYIHLLRTNIPSAQLINLYGPTETNVCTYYILNQLEYSEPLPIGIPCRDFNFFLLDDCQQLIKNASIGELAVEGPHLMKEYWNQNDLNQKAFLLIDNKVFYKTGDLVKLLPNGNLAYIGRKDSQVKLRGFRVELNAIEHLLQKIPGIQDSLVYVLGKNDQAVICASVCLEDNYPNINTSQILNELRQTLPTYALPSKIEFLQDFPRTSTGKIDRKRISSNKHQKREPQ